MGAFVQPMTVRAEFRFRIRAKTAAARKEALKRLKLDIKRLAVKHRGKVKVVARLTGAYFP